MAAVMLMYVGAGLSLLGMFFTVASRSVLRDQLLAEDPEQTSAEQERAVNMASGVSVVIALISVGLWLWMAQANRRGHAWARIVATVLFGLDVVLTGYNLTQTTSFGMVINIISIGLAGAIVWLLTARTPMRFMPPPLVSRVVTAFSPANRRPAAGRVR
jgi:hypothetical protein